MLFGFQLQPNIWLKKDSWNFTGEYFILNYLQNTKGLGPGVTFYNIKASFNTSLTPDEESHFFDKLNDLLENKFPGYDQVINGSGFKETGTMRTTTLGFRYMIMVGFRF